jgi:hypothetical protein
MTRNHDHPWRMLRGRGTDDDIRGMGRSGNGGSVGNSEGGGRERR